MKQDTPDPLPHPDSREFHGELAKIIAHSSRTQLETIQSNPAGPPSDILTPIVISVVRDEVERLPAFLQHYRSIGVIRFVFIDNNSGDDTLSYLSRQEDADVYRTTEPFGWQLKQGWVNSVIDIYGRNRWYIYVDADELITYDGSDSHLLIELVGQAISRGLTRVRGQLIDMYPAGALVDLERLDSSDPFTVAPFFDGAGYTELKLPSRISKRGGPRKRVLGGEGQIDPELTKYPLFYASPVDVFANPHYLWPFEPNFDSPCLIGLLHFKFIPGLKKKVQRAIAEENYWNKSLEYKAYDKILRNRTSLMCEHSRHYSSPADLVNAGIIDPLLWPVQFWQADHNTNPSLTGLKSTGDGLLRSAGPGKFLYRTPAIRVKAGDLLLVTATLGGSLAAEGTRVFVVDDNQNHCGPPRSITSGIHAYCSVPPSAQHVYVEIRGEGKKQGTLDVKSLKIASVPKPPLPAGKIPVIASIASIPSRRDLLEDAVYSLIDQVDRIRVFLNGYRDIPGFLTHPKIQVRRSEDWDDNGDAGKLSWLGEDDTEAHIVLADDDLIYPYDFVSSMRARLTKYADRAIVGVHGVVLRQPVADYYDITSRYTSHFESSVAEDFPVHILGTGCLMFNSKHFRISKSVALFRNMADIWLAREAQAQGVPLYCVAHPHLWVRENKCVPDRDSIWQASHKSTKMTMNSGAIQNYVLSNSYPWLLPAADRERWAFVVSGANPADFLDPIKQIAAMQHASDRKWIVLVACTRSGCDAKLRAALRGSNVSIEIFFVEPQFSLKATASTYSLAGLIIVTGYLALQSRWEDVLNGCDLKVMSQAGKKAGQAFIWRPTAPDQDVEFNKSGWPKSLKTRFQQSQHLAEVERTGRLFGGKHTAPAQITANDDQAPRLNDFFEDIVVLNLKRRPDRWHNMAKRLKALGVRARRFDAIDATRNDVQERFRLYASGRLQKTVSLPAAGSEYDFYLNYKSQAARRAYLEGRTLSRAIVSPGALAHLLSWEKILREAIGNGVSSLLILEDDCMFHKDFNLLLGHVLDELPEDWQILQLGTMQFNWSDKWVRQISTHLQQSLGSAIGSHAVGLKSDAMVKLLSEIQRFELPTDAGALSATVRAFGTANFITAPNLAIQEPGESDILSSGFQATATREEVCRTFRWNEADYF